MGRGDSPLYCEEFGSTTAWAVDQVSQLMDPPKYGEDTARNPTGGGLLESVVTVVSAMEEKAGRPVDTSQWLSPKTNAKGGVATKATLGIFGEAGDEALVPLDRYFGGLPSRSASPTMAGGGGGGTTVIVDFRNSQILSDRIPRDFVDKVAHALGRHVTGGRENIQTRR